MTITSLQIRMARAALNLTLRDLAQQARLPIGALSGFENGRFLHVERLARLTSALESAGIIFVAENAQEGPGVRMARDFRRDFVFDQDGKHVANVLGRSVVDVLQGKTIATVCGDELFTLEGESLGRLGSVDVFQHIGSLAPSSLDALNQLSIAEPSDLLLEAPIESSDHSRRSVRDDDVQ